MAFDSVIFDLDGTLWDSCRTVAESWRETLHRLYGLEGRPSAEDVRGIMGLTAKGVADKLLPDFEDREEMFRLCAEEQAAYLARHGGDIYPDIGVMLRRVSRKYRVFIVSNCQKNYIESFLAFSGFGKYFTGWECEGSTGLSKSENIRYIIKKYGLAAPVYVGDTALDESSAAEARCPFIHAGYGFGQAKAPIAVIDSPMQLCTLLDSF